MENLADNIYALMGYSLKYLAIHFIQFFYVYKYSLIVYRFQKLVNS